MMKKVFETEKLVVFQHTSGARITTIKPKRCSPFLDGNCYCTECLKQFPLEKSDYYSDL